MAENNYFKNPPFPLRDKYIFGLIALGIAGLASAILIPHLILRSHDSTQQNSKAEVRQSSPSPLEKEEFK
jgi:hypothetical protein